MKMRLINKKLTLRTHRKKKLLIIKNKSIQVKMTQNKRIRSLKREKELRSTTLSFWPTLNKKRRGKQVKLKTMTVIISLEAVAAQTQIHLEMNLM